MVHMNVTAMVFALVLIIGVSAAAESSSVIDVLEDELFWSRELQGSLPPQPPPSTTPPLPPPSTTPPPTLAPNTLPPLLPACTLAVSITCNVGEGIECSNYEATPDRCLQDSVFTYTLQNNGTAPLTVIEAMGKITGVDPTNLLPFITTPTLEAGQATEVSQEQRVNYCSTTPINATAVAKADPGGCVAETIIFAFTPSRRRALRGN